MILQISNFIDPSKHTDRELVFLAVLTEIWRRDGYDVKLYMHTLDYKTILIEKRIGMAMPKTKAFEYFMDVMKYSDKTIGLLLHKDIRKPKSRMKGREFKVRYSRITAKITDPRAITLYVYLLGILNSGVQLTKDGVLIEEGQDERPRVLDKINYSAITKHGQRAELLDDE